MTKEFNAFIAECVSAEQTNEKILRLDIYNHYRKWRNLEHNYHAKIPPDTEKGEFLVNTTKFCPIDYRCKFNEVRFYNDDSHVAVYPKSIYGDKIIGQAAFYKLLKVKYGEPPIINRNTKQYKYYMKLNNLN